MKRVADLYTSTYGDVIDAQYAMAVLPWGATEPHNLHLPYATDSILSQALALDAADEALKADARVMVLPPVSLGSQNPGQRELPFCIHTRYETQKAILTDIVASLHHQGIKKMLIVNGHGGNTFKNMIRDLAIDYPDFMLATCEWFKLVNVVPYVENGGEHADEVETAVMLYYRPDLVDMTKAGDGASRKPRLKPLAEGLIWMPRNWSEISDDTGIGNPHLATPQKGEKIAKAVTAVLSNILVEMSRY